MSAEMRLPQALWLPPLVDSFVTDNKGWRWLYWIQLIVAGFIYVLMVLTVPETYAPTILLKRARKLRKETGDNTYVTEQELDSRPLGERLKVYIFRPFQLLFTEIIVLLVAIYMSVLYGLLYMFFIAYVSVSFWLCFSADSSSVVIPLFIRAARAGLPVPLV